jgi:hypothetical protein
LAPSVEGLSRPTSGNHSNRSQIAYLASRGEVNM